MFSPFFPGSNIVTTLKEGIRMRIVIKVEELVKVWSDMENAGHGLIIVSSGATGLGVGKLQINKPDDIVTKQAAAAVGQCELMYTYDRLFSMYNHTVAQMLLTWEDFDDSHRLHNLSNTLERLLQLHAIPVINENDSVSSDEYSVGDNDTLAALTAKCIHADLVVLLSDIDGLYTKDPHSDSSAQLIPVVDRITDATKISAAKIVTKEGIDMIIANGAKADILYDIVEGKPAGTRFSGEKS